MDKSTPPDEPLPAPYYVPPALSPDHAPASDREQARKAFRVWLFEQHGWTPRRAAAWADVLMVRDRQRDDRRLCVECANLSSKWDCRKGGPVLADQLQRCGTFDWRKP